MPPAPDLTNPGLILDEVSGVSTGWGELTLSTPVTSSTGTAYAVFFFPESVTTHALGEGGGPGIGLKETTTDNPAFFLSADALNWARFDSSYALGVEPVYSMLRGVPRTIADLGVLIDLPEQTTQEPEVALETGMLRPHPNPFNPRVQLAYSLAAPSSVRLVVYDVRGRLVKTMVSGAQSAGEHSVMWDGVDEQGRQVASGVYFARFEAGAVVQTQRMVLLR